jgi:hypothetical protein
MEERSGAHRVTQRHLGDPAEEVDESPETTEPTSETPPEAPPEPPSPALAVSRVPSDGELRKRQRAWREERARFEASKPRRESSHEGSK